MKHKNRNISEAKRLNKNLKSNDPIFIAKSLGKHIVLENLGNNIMGYYRNGNRIPIIHINENQDEFGIKFSVAHELGHSILHPKVNTPFLKKSTLFSVDRIEREANQFAIHLIIGDNQPEEGETLESFLLRNGIPPEFHQFY